MLHIEMTQLLHAPHHKVFEAWVDYEALPRWWPSLFKRVTVTKREGNTVHLKTEMKVMGRTVEGTEKHLLMPPSEDRSEAITGGTTARSTWRFEPVADGTKVIWTSDIQLRGVIAQLFGPLARRQIRAINRQGLQRFERYVQAKG